MIRDGNTLWAWQSQEADGRWSLIAMFAMNPITGQQAEMVCLVHRDQSIVANQYRPYAVMHRQSNGMPIRMVRFKLEEVEELDTV